MTRWGFTAAAVLALALPGGATARDARWTPAWGSSQMRIDGANAGLEDFVATSAGAEVTLATLPRLTVAVGDRAEIIEGCDKTIATCAGRFGNAANFRGEPYLPGIDLLTRYAPA